MLRFALTQALQVRTGGQFPWGTLAVNLIGCTAIGVLGGLFDHRHQQSELRLLLVVGLLGGFTTFSSFAYETIRLVESNRLIQAAGYVLMSNGLGIALASIGYVVTKHFAGSAIGAS